MPSNNPFGINTAGSSAAPLDAIYKRAMFGENLRTFRAFTISGFNADIDSGAAESVSPAGGVWVPQQNAEIMQIVSTHAGDTVAGAGARTLLIVGLDSNYDPIRESINLNGLSIVETTQEFLRINFCTVVEFGTFDTGNLGDISITAKVSGTNQRQIPVGNGFCQDSHYTVPKGWTGFFVNLVASVYPTQGAADNSARIGEFSFRTHLNENNGLYCTPYSSLATDGGALVQSLPIPSPLRTKADISALMQVKKSNTSCTMQMEFLLVNDTLPDIVTQIDTGNNG